MDTVTWEERLEQLERELEDKGSRLQQVTVELEQARRQLAERERLAHIGLIAAGIGHELRQPLSVINNIAYCLRLICADKNLPSAAGATAQGHLGRLEEQVALANRVISNLMDYVRTLQPARRSIDLNPLVEKQAGLLNTPAQIRVETQLAAGLPPVLADPAHVERILANLLTNALESMHATGGELLLHTFGEDARVVLEVKDRGPGIPEDLRDKIFQPFFSSKTGGIGLGLALARHLVEANQATITFHSEAGRGTIFQVRFPLAGRQ